MDRPSRKTKVVNYCEAKDFDDDEDFACVKAPPSKKLREDVKQQEHKKSSSKSSSQESSSQSSLSQKSRKPFITKLYARDLEAAITLSLLNDADGIKKHSTSIEEEVKVQLPVDENTDPSSQHLSNCSVDISLLGLDKITSENESLVQSRQRNTASKAIEEQRKILKDEDEDADYQPKMTPDSGSDDDFSEPAESEDEEFMVKKASKTKKEKITKHEKTKPCPSSKKEKQPSKPTKSRSLAAASTPLGSPPTVKHAAKGPVLVSTSKPTISLSPAGGRVPKWTPPGQIGKSPTSTSPAVKSPGQGLRLGLSRRVRVKPLHPSVASH